MDCFTIEHLTFAYEKGTPVLSDLSLTVPAGAWLLLLGGTGSGKTTLLRQMKRELTPAGWRSGAVRYQGVELSDLDDYQSATTIGYVFQNPENQIVTDQVWHELAFGLENMGLSQAEMERRIGEVASFFNMQSWYHKKICELSGGQKQLLNLAAIVTMHPNVILLDEPTSQLDPIAARQFLNMLAQLREEYGITIIMTEHHVESVFAMASQVVVLEHGRICADGKPRAVAQRLMEQKKGALLPMIPRVLKTLDKHLTSVPLTLSQGRSFLEGWCLATGKTRDNLNRDASHLQTVSPKTKKHFKAISVREVYVRYERTGRDVLNHMSFSVEMGECFGVLGGNGAGKTTLLKVIAGQVKPYAGRCQCALRAAYLSQNPQSMFSCDTVFEEVKGMESERLAEFGMEALLERHPYDLSGGQQQRLAFLLLLKSNPDLLLLDEPTKGLDSHSKDGLLFILNKLRADGATIVLVTHDVEFMARACSRCGLLFDGRLTGIADTKTFLLNNQYYTTMARRLTRGLTADVVTEEELYEI